MSLKPLSPAFFLHYPFPSDPPISLCISTTKIFPLAPLLCVMPPSITPCHVPPIAQPFTDGTFILLLMQSKNSPKQDTVTLQSHPGPSSLLFLSLQHQAPCLQAINETIQQVHIRLKADKFDRRPLQIIVLQLQKDFALLRYLLFTSAATTLISETSVNNSAITSPTTLNPNRNPT